MTSVASSASMRARLGRGMLAQHEGAHAGTRELHAEHEQLSRFATPCGRRQTDVPHPGVVAVDTRDERFRLRGRDERHVVAEISRERCRFGGRLVRSGQVPAEDLQSCLVGEDPNKHVVSPDAPGDRRCFRGSLQPSRVVALDHRERQLDVQRPASREVVAAGPIEEDIDPTSALGDGPVPPVLPQTGCHPQPDFHAIRVCKAVPQRRANVAGLEVQQLQRGKPRYSVAAGSVEFRRPAKGREEGEVGSAGVRLFTRLAEAQ